MKYKIIIVVLLLGMAASAGWWFIKRKKARKWQEIECSAMNELLDNIKRFHGFFQILYDAVSNANEEAVDKILNRWKKQSNGLANLSILVERLTQGKPLDAGKRLLLQFEKWGIRHDEKGAVLIAAEELNLYYIMDEFYENGEKLIVESPGWYRKDQGQIMCIEVGIAELADTKE